MTKSLALTYTDVLSLQGQTSIKLIQSHLEI